MPDFTSAHRRITLYREDSTTPVVYERVKHIWYEAEGQVLVVAYLLEDGKAHDYAHWPMRKIAWYREEKIRA